jgi:hypothetical protein
MEGKHDLDEVRGKLVEFIDSSEEYIDSSEEFID